MKRRARRIYSNSEVAERVIGPFETLTRSATRVDVASAFFTHDAPVREAARGNKEVRLLVGLNAATSPPALRAVHGIPNVEVRIEGDGFHAKFYLFDNHALLGSANLTEAGMKKNLEAVIVLERDRDGDAFAELEALFEALWNDAHELTDEILERFAHGHRKASEACSRADALIAQALADVVPQHEDYQGYGKAFREVRGLLTKHGLHREALVAELGSVHETGRFLSYVRQTRVVGDTTWQHAPLRDRKQREAEVLNYAREWAETEDPQIVDHFTDWLRTVECVFGTEEGLRGLSKEELTDALMKIHAVYARSRYFGGETEFRHAFWEVNGNDVEGVKQALAALLYGDGVLAQRIRAKDKAIKEFGRFSALELYGTVHPERFAPINGRIDKALRFLGFDVGRAKRQLPARQQRR